MLIAYCRMEFFTRGNIVRAVCGPCSNGDRDYVALWVLIVVGCLALILLIVFMVLYFN